MDELVARIVPEVTIERAALQHVRTRNPDHRHMHVSEHTIAPNTSTHMPTGTSVAQGTLRVGTDLVEIVTVIESVRQFGERYLRRTYTDAELAYCHESPPEWAARLAARFAAKEAVLKVLRPEGTWPEWRNIEVVRHAHGWCDIVLHGSAATLAARHNTSIVSCSLSHEGSYANAVVLGFVHAR